MNVFIKKGDIFKIGTNDWRLLTIEDNQALFISNLLIDTRSFHIEHKPILYKDGSIREYINHNFLI